MRPLKLILRRSCVRTGAGCSCPDNLNPKFLGLGVQYFHSGVNRLLQQSSEAYLKTMRQAAADAGK